MSSESETLIAERLEGSPAHLGPDPGELEPKSAAEAGKRIAELEAENARLMEALVAAGEAYDVALVRAERFRDMHAALVQAESYLSLLRFRGGVRWKQQGSAFGVDVDEVDEAISLSRAALATPAREPKP